MAHAVVASAAGRETSVAPVQHELFRTEVLQDRQTSQLGTVLLDPKVSQSVAVSVAVAIGLAVILFVIFGTFSRKARINGLLAPTQGIARIVAPQPGVVTQIHVSEGMTVKKGAPLISLSAELQSEALGSTREQIVRRIGNRRDGTSGSSRIQEQLFDQQAADLQKRNDALDLEQKHLAKEIEFQRARLKISSASLTRDRTMRAQDLIPLPRLQRTEQDYLDNQVKLESMERSKVTLRREQLLTQATLQELPLRRQTQLAEIGRSVDLLDQELAEAESRRLIVINAPYDGTVTAIQAENGANAQTNIPLMSVVPAGSVLQASLYGASRTIGFIKAGQTVSLRYQAYPYQKFGAYAGVVTSVSRSAINPLELPQQLAGLYDPKEPLYRINVELVSQTATAYGQPGALQPGMQLEADVVIDTRRLIEWVFDPLYTLTGKQAS